MQESVEHKQGKSELVEKVGTHKSSFKDLNEALTFYCRKLEKIRSSHGKSVDELVLLAESEATHSAELMEVLSLVKTINGLKSFS